MSGPRSVCAPVLLACLACTGHAQVEDRRGAPVIEEPAPPAPVPPPRAPTSGPQAPAPAPLTGDLGTSHPTIIEAAAPTGHWVALCQARADSDGDGKIAVELGHHGETRGDAMLPYLVREAGPGQAITAFVGSDQSGRLVAIVDAERRLVVLDTWEKREIVLAAAETADDPNPFGGHRAASFDAAGRRVAYARTVAGEPAVVVRDLTDETERTITTHAKLLWRFELDRAGEFVWLWTVDRDSDGDGALELPEARTSLRERACRGPVASYGHYGWRGDEAVREVAPVQDGAIARPEPAGLMIVQGRILLRKDRALISRGADGDRELVPASCGAKMVHVQFDTGVMYVACHAQGTPGELDFVLAPLVRHDSAGNHDLGVKIQIRDGDPWVADGEPIYTVENMYVQPQTGTIGPAHGGPIEKIDGDRMLFAGPTGVFVHDLKEKTKRALPVSMRGWGPRADQGPLLARMVDDTRAVVFDFSSETMLGYVDGSPYGLATNGAVLVAHNPADPDLPLGPLRWVAPK